MAVQPLRNILSFQSVLVAVLPFVLTATLGAFWLFPHFKADIETPQHQTAAAIGLRVESYLTEPMNVIRGIAALPLDHYLELHDIQAILDTQRRLAQALRSVYLVGGNGRVIAVSLRDNQRQQQDLMGLDLSGNRLFKEVQNEGTGVWSDTFLSIVGGGISVALAEPSGPMTVIGEIDLSLLSSHLRHLSSQAQQLILVLDRKGQIIADKRDRYTAQQLNISHIPFIKEGLRSPATSIQTFNFDGHTLIGSLIKTSLLDWHVLVATPRHLACRPMWVSISIFSAALVAAILVGVLVAMVMARRLAYRFEGLTHHARRISVGEPLAQWPQANITEFKELADDLQQMADSIQEREAYNRVLFADSPVPQVVIDPETAGFRARGITPRPKRGFFVKGSSAMKRPRSTPA
jgi:HAMP domain-containing protein